MATLDINVRQANADFQAIKSEIIEKGVDVAEGTPTAEYAPKIDEVYEAGKQAQYDEFWDGYQQNGKRYHYTYAFYQRGWTDETYKPKYPFVLKYCYAMYHATCITDTLYELDFTTLADATEDVFRAANNLKTIRPITVNENTTFINWFHSNTALENLTIKGTIGQNGLNVQWSPLSHASLMSIINALKDNSGTENWNEIVLGSDNIAKLTQEERAIMDTKQWIYT